MYRSGQILDFLSQKECGNLLKILEHIPNQTVSSHKKILTNGFTKQDVIFGVIHKWFHLLQKPYQIPFDRLSIGMLLKAYEPFEIHTDFSGKNDSGHGMAYLIPLRVTGSDPENTYTVIFNEASISSNRWQDYVASEPKKPPSNIKDIWQDLPNSDLPEHYAEYFSVSHLARWHLGSLIYWDRTLFHSSDNFLNKGISLKEALVLFTSQA